MRSGPLDGVVEVVGEASLLEELKKAQNLYRWGDYSEDEYLADKRRITRALDELGDDPRPATPSEETLKLAGQIGEA